MCAYVSFVDAGANEYYRSLRDARLRKLSVRSRLVADAQVLRLVDGTEPNPCVAIDTVHHGLHFPCSGSGRQRKLPLRHWPAKQEALVSSTTIGGKKFTLCLCFYALGDHG